MLTIVRKLCLLFLLGAALNVWAQRENRLFYVFDASNGLADNSAQIVMCTKTGRILTTTIGHVNFYDGYSFIHIDPKPSDAAPLPGYDGRYQIYFDHFHHLWMKHDHMMQCVDLLTERCIGQPLDECRKMGVTKSVDDFFGDSQSYMWFRSGNTLFSPALKKTVTLRQGAVLQDVENYRDSLLLLFYADGAVAVNDFKTCRLLYSDDAFSATDREQFTRMSDICLDGNQIYQLRCGDSESVLLCYDIPSRKWKELLRKPFKMNCLVERNHQIYIGTDRGYLVYDHQTGQQTHVEELVLTKGRSIKGIVSSLIFDRQGGMWLGTERRGLLYAKPYIIPFKSYLNSSAEAQPYLREIDRAVTAGASLPRKVNTVYFDSRGWRWTGSFTGLELVKPNGSRRVFTSRDGLTNEVVRTVIEDNQHDIWVGTSYGIAHLFVRGDSVYHLENYINQDNIPSESFYNGRVAKMSDGTIIMQGTDHVVVFNPAHFRGKKFGDIVLSPKLTRLMVDGTVVEAGDTVDGRVILERSITRTREFSVDYNQNSLELFFSGLNYVRPVQTYYRLRVKGVPAYNDWHIYSYGKGNHMVDKNGRLRLSLSGLQPGRYVVELQVSLWPETWPQEPYKWIINVEEPWWRSTGIYLLLCIVLLGLLMTNVFFYNRNMRLRITRQNEDLDLLRRVKAFATRCRSLSAEVLKPYSIGQQGMQDSNMSSEFISAMMLVVPYVNRLNGDTLTMEQVSRVGKVPLERLYEMLPSQLDKNPRQLVGRLRLQEAARLLQTTDMSVEQISDQLLFASPSYFIAAFYHQYRKTPADYRSSMAR